jgi:hypothetical protein
VKVKIRGVISALTSYMQNILAGDIDKFLNEWTDPFAVKKNQMIILPDRITPETDATIAVHMIMLVSLIGTTAKKIADDQIAVMEKIYNAVLFGEDIGSPVLEAKITGGDFFEPVPGTPRIGIIQINVDLITDYLVD